MFDTKMKNAAFLWSRRESTWTNAPAPNRSTPLAWPRSFGLHRRRRFSFRRRLARSMSALLSMRSCFLVARWVHCPLHMSAWVGLFRKTICLEKNCERHVAVAFSILESAGSRKYTVVRSWRVLSDGTKSSQHVKCWEDLHVAIIYSGLYASAELAKEVTSQLVSQGLNCRSK